MSNAVTPKEAEALRHLDSPDGPLRFARVAEGIYRGGQPTRGDLVCLAALGVRTVVNLRRENRDAVEREKAQAHALGMRFLHHPFYGVFGADELFLLRVIEDVKQRNVYVHCKHGRDRTSLLVALYRVIEEGWEPVRAWQLEAIDYGSAQTYFYRQLRVVFNHMATKYLRHEAPEFHEVSK